MLGDGLLACCWTGKMSRPSLVLDSTPVFLVCPSLSLLASPHPLTRSSPGAELALCSPSQSANVPSRACLRLQHPIFALARMLLQLAVSSAVPLFVPTHMLPTETCIFTPRGADAGSVRRSVWKARNDESGQETLPRNKRAGSVASYVDLSLTNVNVGDWHLVDLPCTSIS